MPRNARQAEPEAEAKAPTQYERICDAAFHVLMERGYADASTLEIATRARVSKRELYALFGGKQGILAAMIASRAARMRLPLSLPSVSDREQLGTVLGEFGREVIRGFGNPGVLAIFRLAIGEAKRSPELAEALETAGRQPNLAALTQLLAEAQARKLLPGGDAGALAAEFIGLLWSDLMIQLLLGIAPAPAEKEMSRRGRAAAQSFLTLHPAPEKRSVS